MWAEDSSLSCVQEMLTPNYGAMARRASRQGTVTATVKLDADGQLTGLRLESPDESLASEVETILRYSTKFKANCSSEVVVRFTFVLEGAPVTSPTVRISFRSPNEFVIRSQPRAPITDLF